MVENELSLFLNTPTVEMYIKVSFQKHLINSNTNASTVSNESGQEVMVSKW